MSSALGTALRASLSTLFGLAALCIQSAPAATFRPMLPEGEPAPQQRSAAAASTAAGNAACTSLTPFYWEIGDRNGRLASGNGGDNSSTPPGATTPMAIASASKWLFSTYAVEKRAGQLTASDIHFLTFTSGYTNFDSCPATASVASCLSAPGANGGSNGDYIAANDGKFYYNGGHMQVMAGATELGPLHNAALTTEVQSVLGADVDLLYFQPQLAGGVYTTPNDYAQFLRNMLAGGYRYMAPLLGAYAVCTHPNSVDCPTAVYSPLNQSQPGPVNDLGDEAWHYSLGHWVEDDPQVGDGAFSSAGAFGFYPWIDRSKTYYGILARVDTRIPRTRPAGKESADCGRLIRAAWISGRPQ